jgi:hypothetical protein
MLDRRVIVASLFVFLGAAVQSRPGASEAAKPSSTQPADVAAYLECANAVVLAEVGEITRFNRGAADGPAGEGVTLKVIKSAGEKVVGISILQSGGGRGPPGVVRSVTHGPLYPNPLEVGKRYWFVFDGSQDVDKYPQRVIAWWPEGAAPTKALEEALGAERFLWHPRSTPGGERWAGYRMDGAQWTLRVWTKERKLWEKTFEGLRGDRLNLWEVYANREVPERQIVAAVWESTLAANNSLGVPAGTYTLYSRFDLETGKLVGNRASQESAGISVEQELSLKTGKVTFETREEYFKTGGIAVGEGQEGWYRTTETRYDEDGKKISEEFFRGTGGGKIPLKK